MAILECNFMSKSIWRMVTFNAVIPTHEIDSFNNNDDVEEIKAFKTLYLLHGITGNHTAWLSGSRIKSLAEDNNLAVIMPAGENSFYVDNPNGNKFGEYIGEEIVNVTRAMFNLSKKREDTFIAGLSMGGYGALRNGLKYNETFSKIGAFSSALIIDEAVNSTDNEPFYFATKTYYESVFGDIAKLKGSDKDLEALILSLKENNKNIPEIYMACGTEDFLLQNNRKFKDFLKCEGINLNYEEGIGSHEWKFWDVHIEKFIKWLNI